MQKSIITSYRNIISTLDTNDSDMVSHLIASGCPETCADTVANLMHIYSLRVGSLLPGLVAGFVGTPEAGQGLARFEHFLETNADTLSLESYPDELPLLIGRVIAFSSALTVRLTTMPDSIAILATLDDPFTARTESTYYLEQLTGAVSSHEQTRDRIRAIHAVHTAQLARICCRNSDPETGIDEINAELSALAGAVIETCLNIAATEIIPAGTTHGFFVLGLGKFGGQELNVSSDVDLIYLSSHDESWESFESMTLHTRLAERLTQILSEATPQGYLYRVDTRLRADGASGPLVRTTGDYLRYLEMRGQAWERQMLLKARTVAGVKEGGAAFLKAVSRFVYPSSITRSPNREVVALKTQIESRLVADGSKNTHLKLMPGGIRDIEFITQCLQLLMGGMHPSVRKTGTLPALFSLHSVNALTDGEYDTLRSAYTLYRRIENVLQWRELLPAFTIPNTPVDLERIGAILAVPDLNSELTEHFQAVRAIFNDVFSVEQEDSFEVMAVRAAQNHGGDEQVRRFLENLGFTDPLQSADDLAHLVFGKTERGADIELHPSIALFLPRLLKTLGDLPDPGSALTHFKLIADAYNARTALFDVMNRNEKFFELLISITHGSVFMTNLLAGDPSLLDWLIESQELMHRLNLKSFQQELALADSNSADDRSFSKRCLKLKKREELRIGSRDIAGIATDAETFEDLSGLAESIVGTVYRKARHASVSRTLDFTVLTAGKLGSSHMDFGSDLDLVFVYDCTVSDEDIRLPQFATKLAQHILNLLAGRSVYRIYEVDARLRPEGSSAPLAVSFAEYKRYLSVRAAAWERLALVRGRFLTGSVELGARSMSLIHRFVYRGPLTSDEISSIRDIREVMIAEAERLSDGAINIKTGRGGIADIDFIAHAWACHTGSPESPPPTTTPGILSVLSENSTLDRHDATSLIELYHELLGIEKAIRIGSGKSVNTLPQDGAELARVARLRDFKNIRQFSRRLTELMHLSRTHYDRLMDQLHDSVNSS